jgi:hypothetical protein
VGEKLGVDLDADFFGETEGGGGYVGASGAGMVQRIGLRGRVMGVTHMEE